MRLHYTIWRQIMKKILGFALALSVSSVIMPSELKKTATQGQKRDNKTDDKTRHENYGSTSSAIPLSTASYDEKTKKEQNGQKDIVMSSDILVTTNPSSGFTDHESQLLTRRLTAFLRTFNLLVVADKPKTNSDFIRHRYLCDNVIRAAIRYMSFYKSRGYSFGKFVLSNTNSERDCKIFQEYLDRTVDCSKCNPNHVTACRLLIDSYEYIKGPVLAIDTSLKNPALMSEYFYRKYARSDEHNDTDASNKFISLLDAIRSEDETEAVTIIKKGASVAGHDEFGSTPLHYAVLHNQDKVVDSLLQYKASVDVHDKIGCMPQQLCMKSKPLVKISTITEAIAVRRKKIEQARSKINGLRKIVNAHDKITEQEKSIAQAERELEFFEQQKIAIIQTKKDNDAADKIRKTLSKTDINAQDSSGNTALTTCAYRFLDVAVSACLESGARIDIVNNHGQNALACAVIGALDKKNDTTIEKTTVGMILANAKNNNTLSKVINGIDDYGKTALDYCLRYADCTESTHDACMHKKMIAMLQENGAKTALECRVQKSKETVKETVVAKSSNDTSSQSTENSSSVQSAQNSSSVVNKNQVEIPEWQKKKERNKKQKKDWSDYIKSMRSMHEAFTQEKEQERIELEEQRRAQEEWRAYNQFKDVYKKMFEFISPGSVFCGGVYEKDIVQAYALFKSLVLSKKIVLTKDYKRDVELFLYDNCKAIQDEIATNNVINNTMRGSYGAYEAFKGQYKRIFNNLFSQYPKVALPHEYDIQKAYAKYSDYLFKCNILSPRFTLQDSAMKDFLNEHCEYVRKTTQSNAQLTS